MLSSRFRLSAKFILGEQKNASKPQQVLRETFSQDFTNSIIPKEDKLLPGNAILNLF